MTCIRLKDIDEKIYKNHEELLVKFTDLTAELEVSNKKLTEIQGLLNNELIKINNKMDLLDEKIIYMIDSINYYKQDSIKTINKTEIKINKKLENESVKNKEKIKSVLDEVNNINELIRILIVNNLTNTVEENIK